MQTHAHTSITEKMRECINECQSCHDICIETTMHCLSMGGKHASPEHIGLLLDCAEISQTSANYMLRRSELHPSTCGVCAEVCKRCAESCDQFGDDTVMEQCAQSCRSCAESCREMAHS